MYSLTSVLRGLGHVAKRAESAARIEDKSHTSLVNKSLKAKIRSVTVYCTDHVGHLLLADSFVPLASPLDAIGREIESLLLALTVVRHVVIELDQFFHGNKLLDLLHHLGLGLLHHSGLGLLHHLLQRSVLSLLLVQLRVVPLHEDNNRAILLFL